MTADSPLLNVTEAADYLRCSASYLNKLRVTGGGPTFVKMGARVAYTREDLDRYIAKLSPQIDGGRQSSIVGTASAPQTTCHRKMTAALAYPATTP